MTRMYLRFDARIEINPSLYAILLENIFPDPLETAANEHRQKVGDIIAEDNGLQLRTGVNIAFATMHTVQTNAGNLRIGLVSKPASINFPEAKLKTTACTLDELSEYFKAGKGGFHLIGSPAADSWQKPEGED